MSHESTTLYRKVQQGAKVRYEPVAEHVTMDSLPYGTHLVTVAKGSVSRRFCVEPSAAMLLAELTPLREELITLFREATEARPRTSPLTEPQHKAWRRFIEEAGDGARMLTYGSAVEMADRVLAGLAQKIKAHAEQDSHWLARSEPVTV
jgi:hypothetical protein